MSSEHADVLRESVARLVAELMDVEVSAQIGAQRGRGRGALLLSRGAPSLLWRHEEREVHMT